MNKTLIAIVTFLLCLSLAFSRNKYEIEELRVIFYSAIQNDDKMDDFRNKLLQVFGEYNTKIESLGIAYWGIYHTLIAKHSYNPYTKLKELKKGLDIIDQAIQKDKKNLEIRFLRFSVLHHIPDFFGYNDEKKDDAQAILDLLKSQDFSKLDFKFQKGIAEFMIKSNRINQQSVQDLTNIYLK